MCGRKPRPDPRIAEQQAQQRADVEAAKQAERDKVAKEKAAALEESRAEAARIADIEAAATRQAEMEKVVKEPEPAAVAKPKAAAPSMAASNLSAATTASPETPEVIEEAVPVKSTAQEREKRVAKFGQTATAGRRRKRSGSRGRRSLITGLGGGIGYFNRFGG
tara:strand:- start:2109 stop:2600 length:492 start_codon:yes stop_codon:yes gene_type:complete